jgi:hypothetical protein
MPPSSSGTTVVSSGSRSTSTEPPANSPIDANDSIRRAEAPLPGQRASSRSRSSIGGRPWIHSYIERTLSSPPARIVHERALGRKG